MLATPVGGAAFISSTFKNDALEVHIESPLGKFLFKGEYKASGLSDTWSIDNGLKGTWEGKKVIASNAEDSAVRDLNHAPGVSGLGKSTCRRPESAITCPNQTSEEYLLAAESNKHERQAENFRA